MSLQKTRQAIQFAGGIASKQDAKQVASTQLLDLQNATFIKGTTLAKRNGYESLGNLIEGSASVISDPRGLAVRDDTELVQFAGAPAHAYSYVDATGRWSDVGPVDSVVATAKPLAATGTQQSMPDIATNRGVTVAAWEDSAGGVWASVVDEASQRILVSPTQLDANGTKPRCLRVGEVLHILYADVTNGYVWVVVVNPAIPTAALVPNILINDLAITRPVYDAEPTGYGYSADQPGIIVWCNKATAISDPGSYRVGYIHPSGVIGSPVTGLPSAATNTANIGGAIAVGWWQTNPNPAAPQLVVMYVTSSTLVYRFLDGTNLSDLSLATGAAISATSGITRATCAWDDSQVWFAAERDAGGDATLNLVKTGSVTTAGVVTLAGTTRGHGLVTRAFYDSGGVCVGLVHPAFYFSYVAVVRLSTGGGPSVPIAGRFVPGSSPGLPTRSHLSSVIPSDVDAGSTTNVATKHRLPLLAKIQLVSANGDKFSVTGIQVFELDFANAEAWQTAELGRGLYIGSACMMHYDGRTVAEADFHCAPDTAAGTISATPSNAAGSMTSSGDYLYQLCYEAIDAQGEVHRGAVTPGPLVTMGGGDKEVTLTIPTLRLTARTQVRVGIYRSAFNQTGDISTITFYRVASIDPTTSGDAANGYVLSDPTADTVTFLDRLSDADLLLQEELYTNGGVRSNDPASNGGGVLVGGSNRLFWTDPLDGNMVRYSDQIADTIAVEMPNSINLRADPLGGRIVALGILDDAKIIFKETAIHGFGGPGPNPNPDQGQEAFSPPQLLTSDVGCKSPRSIVQSPIGIAFQSEKGIMLLGRDRQVVDIGRDVYAYNSQTVVRATLLPDRHQLIFLTDAGRTLLYDYEVKQWSTYTNHEGVDAVVLNGTYHYLRNDGRVFRETIGVYADDNSQIPMVIETAWIKMSGVLQGWQRILHALVIGEYESAHSLRTRFRLDYEAAYFTYDNVDQTAVYNPDYYGAGIYGAGTYGGVAGVSSQTYQTDYHVNRRCEAISFQFSDVEPTGSFGASFQLSELLLIGGELAVKFRVGSAKQA